MAARPLLRRAPQGGGHPRVAHAGRQATRHDARRWQEAAEEAAQVQAALPGRALLVGLRGPKPSALIAIAEPCYVPHTTQPYRAREASWRTVADKSSRKLKKALLGLGCVLFLLPRTSEPTRKLKLLEVRRHIRQRRAGPAPAELPDARGSHGHGDAAGAASGLCTQQRNESTVAFTRRCSGSSAATGSRSLARCP